MTDRIWVIEVWMDDAWHICDFARDSGMQIAYTNYTDARDAMRKKQEWLIENGNPDWKNQKFRIKEYIPLR